MLVAVCAFVAGQFTGALLVKAAGDIDALRNGNVIEQMVVLTCTWAFVIPLALWLLPTAARVSLVYLGLARPNLATLAIAAGGALAATLLVGAIGTLDQSITHQPHPQNVALAFTTIHQPAALVFFIVVATVVSPIAEETIFRLFIFNFGLRYGGFWLGAILSATLFGLSHFDIYNAAPLAAAGFVFCAVYYFSKNAFASMIAHGLFNAITLIALLIDPSAASR